MAYASGRNALAICDRCGFAYKYLDIQTEPGTRWGVCRTCNDGAFSFVSHPQNYSAPPSADPMALFDAQPDRTEPTSVSAMNIRDSVVINTTVALSA